MKVKHKKIHLRRRTRFGAIQLIALWFFLTLVIAWPLISGLKPSKPEIISPSLGGVNYLIIAPRGLQETALAWVEYRESTGYRTRLVLLPPDQAKTENIREFVQKAYAESGNPYPFYVLLIGHAHLLSSRPDTFLPAGYFSIDPEKFFFYGSDPIASDDGYAGEYFNGIPRNTLPIFIGRIPARTEDEGLLLLERTKTYEQHPPVGESRARIELVTSDAGFGPQYEPVFDFAIKTLVQKILPDEVQWHMLSGSPGSPYWIQPSLFPEEVAKRLDAGSLAMVYIGHGQPELIAWAVSPDGSRGRIFGAEDAEIIQNAHATIGIFTACSAGDYDLAGDNLSVIESIYLTPGGPVAAYSSSAFINGPANGRLVVDLLDALLIEKAATMGEWVGKIEYPSGSTTSSDFLTAAVKALIPRFSGLEKHSLISAVKADQVLDIQHATYNLFGDPALLIAYPQKGMKVQPRWIWQPGTGSLDFSGNSGLPEGTPVWVSLERIPGKVAPQLDSVIGEGEHYLQANDVVIVSAKLASGESGKFSGRMKLPPGFRGSKYLLRAMSVNGQSTYTSAQPVYIGWPPVGELLSSAVFWWVMIGLCLGWMLIRHFRSLRRNLQ